MAAFAPARDGTVAIRLQELECRVSMAWFDAQPATLRDQLRVHSGTLVPPPAFISAELARAGVAIGFDGGLILPPLAA